MFFTFVWRLRTNKKFKRLSEVITKRYIILISSERVLRITKQSLNQNVHPRVITQSIVKV
jgi:hypothetical protein